jgi:hypothetical protein
MEGECPNHDKVFPADGGTVARNQPSHQAATCPPRRTTDTSPCSASHHRARIGVTMKPPCWQAYRYHSSARHTALARAYARDREDPDGGLHPNPGPGQGGGSSSPQRRGPGRGCCIQIPEHAASAHRRQGGQDVLSTGKNPHHRHRTASGMCSLASD